jgi:hypothetical protein
MLVGRLCVPSLKPTSMSALQNEPIKWGARAAGLPGSAARRTLRSPPFPALLGTSGSRGNEVVAGPATTAVEPPALPAQRPG